MRVLRPEHSTTLFGEHGEEGRLLVAEVGNVALGVVIVVVAAVVIVNVVIVELYS